MMRSLRTSCMALVVGLLATACGNSTPPLGTLNHGVGDTAIEGLDPADFIDAATIDNQWWPLTPGSEWIWEGEAFEEDTRIERRLVGTVTDLVKTIGGINAAVAYERDFNDGEMGEVELIFLAQDNAGNIWHLGQYSEIHEEGQFVGGSAWIAGHLEGAKPGIMMPANPTLDLGQYSEGYAPPPYFWDDNAKVTKVGQRVCVKAGCYDDVIVIREFEPLKPGQGQLKYYAPGVGNIKTGWDGKDDERESLELVKKRQLDATQLAEIREAALELETRAYVYGGTQPSVRRQS